VLSGLYELREELIILFTSEDCELADLLNEETWCNKAAFLSDISQALKTVTRVRRERMKIFLLVLIKLSLSRKN
jgi:hypothetical protein